MELSSWNFDQKLTLGRLEAVIVFEHRSSHRTHLNGEGGFNVEESHNSLES